MRSISSHEESRLSVGNNEVGSIKEGYTIKKTLHISVEEVINLKKKKLLVNETYPLIKIARDLIGRTCIRT